jgi:single-stranded-DNA-specific exonuclease
MASLSSESPSEPLPDGPEVMTHWIEPEPVEIPASLAEEVGGHRLVAETLVRRGIRTRQAARAFLDPSIYQPASPGDLPGMETAVDRLRRAVERRETIAIWGDFDADGQTSTALLLECLRSLGARVSYHIPSRQEGHGMQKTSLERFLRGKARQRGPEEAPGPAAGAIRLLITCDTGSSAHAAVIGARRLGADVIITDHHVPGDSLPPALAVINPHLLSPEHPMTSLTGVGVAYQVARALDPMLAERSLDLVALGTIADVGTLTEDNRYLVQCGLEALRCTDRPGLQALYQSADLNPAGLTEEHIGFVLGPRLNALGRLANASHGVELLTTTDRTIARTLATEVEGLNARRQWLTRQVMEGALSQIERTPTLLHDYHALVLSHPAWPGGVTGIVAGRLAERFGKRVALISAPPDQRAVGSARSVPGLNLIQALTDCAAPAGRPPLFERYGGHRGAAGFSLDAERIPELRAALSRAVGRQAESLGEPTLALDAYVELPDLTLDLVGDTSRLAPFGQGNPPLVLAVRDLRLLSETTIGRTGEHRRLTVEDTEDRTQTVFWWQGADWSLPRGRFDLALTIRASDYRGLRELQVEWVDARQREPEAIEIETTLVIDVQDYRTVSNAEQILRGLLSEADWQIWAEGEELPKAETCTRQKLDEGPSLAVWTLPPGPAELQEALTRVRPAEVALFAHDPGLNHPTDLLRQLAGMVTFALRTRDGMMELDRAAAKLGHRRSTVAAGLEVLAAQGWVEILDRQDDMWHLSKAASPAVPEAEAAGRARLQELLDESAAFREYARRAPARSLLTY